LGRSLWILSLSGAKIKNATVVKGEKWEGDYLVTTVVARKLFEEKFEMQMLPPKSCAARLSSAPS